MTNDDEYRLKKDRERNHTMQLTTSETERKKRVERYGGLLMLAITCFFVFVCTPVYVLTSSNIMISRTIFPVLWDFVQDVAHYLYYWIAFAFLSYLFARYSAKATRFLILVYVKVLLYANPGI
jgi:hypothetical protein